MHILSGNTTPISLVTQYPLNLAKDHPLYGKVTCSPDGYCQALDGSIVLLEFKCPFKCKIAVNKTPAYYRDQIQTGLALSGELVTKGVFVDACFRMCSLSQLGMHLAHNASPHGGVVHNTKTPFPRAWGICILESRQKLTPNQASLLNLGTTTSQPMFARAMFPWAISECTTTEYELSLTHAQRLRNSPS